MTSLLTTVREFAGCKQERTWTWPLGEGSGHCGCSRGCRSSLRQAAQQASSATPSPAKEVVSLAGAVSKGPKSVILGGAQGHVGSTSQLLAGFPSNPPQCSFPASMVCVAGSDWGRSSSWHFRVSRRSLAFPRQYGLCSRYRIATSRSRCI